MASKTLDSAQPEIQPTKVPSGLLNAGSPPPDYSGQTAHPHGVGAFLFHCAHLGCVLFCTPGLLGALRGAVNVAS